MRKYIIYLAVAAVTAFLAYAVSGCEREEARPVVAIAGDFINTPDATCGFVRVGLPADLPRAPKEEWPGKSINNSQPCALLPQAYAVNGSCTFFDRIDPARSTMRYTNLVFDPETNGIKGDVHITLSDAQGNQLYLAGNTVRFPDYTNKSFMHFEGGTGIFVNSEGWMTLIGKVNSTTHVNVLTAFGEVTAPKN